MTAKFTKEQPPVRMVNIGDGYYMEDYSYQYDL